MRRRASKIDEYKSVRKAMEEEGEREKRTGRREGWERKREMD